MQEPRSISCYLIGSESLLIQCAGILLDKGHDIRGIISNEPAIIQWGRERNLPTLDALGDIAEKLVGTFDYLFSITNLTLLPDAALARPSRAAINFHDGLLPFYAGLYTPFWALVNREGEYGITWHVMRKKVDEGDILVQKRFEISSGETSLTLNTKCYAAGIESFGPLVDALASGTSATQPQDLSQKKYFGKWKRPDAACVLDFSRPALEIEALIRALDFGRYENPIGVAKLLHAGKYLLVSQASMLEFSQTAAPGTLVHIEKDAVVIATNDGALRLSAFSTPNGKALNTVDAIAFLGLQSGDQLDSTTSTVISQLTSLNAALCRNEAFWVRRLSELDPLEMPYLRPEKATSQTFDQGELDFDLPSAFSEHCQDPDKLLAGCVAYLARLTGRTTFDVALRDAHTCQFIKGFESIVAENVPLHIVLDEAASAEAGLAAIRAAIQLARSNITFLRDAIPRFPALRGNGELTAGRLLPVLVEIKSDLQSDKLPDGVLFRLIVRSDGMAGKLQWNAQALDMESAKEIRSQLLIFLGGCVNSSESKFSDLELLSHEDRHRILVDWNATSAPYDSKNCIHELFEGQVQRTPDARAATFLDKTLNYHQLNARANQLAGHLRNNGIGPDKLVGVFVARSLDLLVSILAIHKAGGAYVPLDPAYPRDRIAYMIEDSNVSVVLTQEHVAAELPPSAARVVRIDTDWKEISLQSAANLGRIAQPENLAYVIYTSGSTGKPKGVMIEHRNVSNFFTGMDARIPHAPPGVWLAVTSLSFDISVLELYWTLTRGFEVVVFADQDRLAGKDPKNQISKQPMNFGIFLWGSDDAPGPAKYKLMLESARFADRNGFSSISTPERHFHAFGGPYPNPSVTSAAIAAVTERIQIRAGSCVLPLHHPIRVAEEWAVVDNLSNGRVAISFAAGWQPNDFVIRKEGYADAKTRMFRDIDIVRKLWRGEAVPFENPLGNSFEARTLPRPVQKELPCWVTAAGNAETFRMAGEAGANMLTHLLGQSLDEVAEKVKIYRKARADAGHDPKSGLFTLMLHTFVGEDDDEVREIVRLPMKNYLSSAMSLVVGFAWSFPAFKRPGGPSTRPEDVDLKSLSDEERDAILEFAFERYFETSGLFGSVETCLQMVERVKAAGVDEIACLIDYGVPSDQMLASLPLLNRVRSESNQFAVNEATPRGNFSLAAQVEQRGVTHMQCTPSMAKMMTMNNEMRAALSRIPNLFIGGEAFPVSLARELHSCMSGSVTNMYGPTETTIWSTTQPVIGTPESISIGKPIANTTIYILDKHMQPMPAGVAGELLIGGAGVVRGYHQRPELTAERFVKDPFSASPSNRLYRTGDSARWNRDGTIDFLGRLDHQVKIRGYRIELGEIEATLGRNQAVRECVVVAREDTPGDTRLVAYYVAKGAPLAVETLREPLRASLPEFMVPSAFVALPSLPLTPNGKIDRKALPPPDAPQARVQREYVAPTGGLEETIAAVWREMLHVENVGINDNFFDLGGHSLLVVQVHRALRDQLDRPLSLTDLYRFPTIGSLSTFLSSDDGGAKVVQDSQARGQKRRDTLLQNRRKRG